MNYVFSQTDTLHQNQLTPNLMQQITPILSSFRSNSYRQIIESSNHRIIESSVLESIVALGLSWDNPFHPHAEYIKLYIDNQIQGEAILLEQLLDHLEKGSTSSGDRLIYASADIQKNIIQALTASGYKLVRKTYEPTLSVDVCLNYLSCLSSSSSVMMYREMMKDSSLKDSFFRYLKEIMKIRI